MQSTYGTRGSTLMPVRTTEHRGTIGNQLNLHELGLAELRGVIVVVVALSAPCRMSDTWLNTLARAWLTRRDFSSCSCTTLTMVCSREPRVRPRVTADPLCQLVAGAGQSNRALTRL